MHSSPRDQALFAVWREYAQTAFELMTGRVGDIGDGGTYEIVQEWQPRNRDSEDAVWTRRPTRKPWIWPLISEMDSELQSLTEYHSAVTALRANAVIASQLGNLVGTVLGSSLLAEDELIEGLLQETVLRSGQLGFDEEAFRGAYLHIEGALYAEHLRFKMIAPTFQTKFTRLPLVLDDNLKNRRDVIRRA